MIQVRLSEEKDLNQIQNVLNDEVASYRINYNTSMVIEERGTIYGFGGYRLIDHDPDNITALIDILVIKEEHRLNYFGDSLIKSILNLIDRRSIKKAYIVSDEQCKKFYQKVKMTEVDPEELELDILNLIGYESGKVIFLAELPEFFNTACRSKGN